MFKTKCTQSESRPGTSKNRYALRNITNDEVRQIVTRSQQSKILQQNETMKRKEQGKPPKRRKIQQKLSPSTTKEQQQSSARQNKAEQENQGEAAAEQNDSGPGSSIQIEQQQQQRPAVALVELFRKLEQILGAKCVNVVDRLKLEYTPYCVQNMEFCSTHHSKKCPRPRTVDRYESKTAKHLIDEGRAFHFLKFVEDMCMRAEFPGEYIISRIWELILTVNPVEYERYSSSDVIKECILVFENILYIFPPCWIPSSYYNVLTQPIDLKNILPSSNASQQTILQFVITMLNKVMFEEDTVAAVDPSQAADVSEEFFNFQEWEARNSSKHNFEVLSRTEKLDRLFVILYLITKILELDLSIWMLRNLSKPSKHIYGGKGPLVSAVFNFDLMRQVTEMVKHTLKVFVCCTCFSYPSDKINFISRLVSVLSVAINLCEQSTTKNIKYPNIGQITEGFAKEIFKTIDRFAGRNVPHYLAVVERIKTPFVKYLLIEEILFKMNPDSGKMGAKKVVDNFRKKRWLQCFNYERASSTELNILHKYPVVPSKLPKPKATEIYQLQYLNILLEALKAYCDVFGIKEVALIFNPNGCPPSPQESDKLSRKPGKSKIDLNEPLQLDRMERDITKLVKKLNMKQKRYSAVSEPEKVDGIHVDDNVMYYYKTELKNLYWLGQIISAYRREHGPIFDTWYNFIQNDLFQVK